MRVARQYSHKASLLIYSYVGEIEDEVHRRHLVNMLADMFDNVPRGRGYCLHRSQLKNLAYHIMFQKVKQTRKAKAYV